MNVLSTVPTEKSILDNLNLKANDMYESTRSHKEDEVIRISEDVIEEFVLSDMVYSSYEAVKCPNDKIGPKLLRYYKACAETGCLFRDNIHTDVLDVFRWLDPDMSLYYARKAGVSFECFSRSYSNMRHLLDTFEIIDTPQFDDIDEELAAQDAYYKISRSVHLFPPKRCGVIWPILELLYEIIYQRVWDKAISEIHHIPHAEFIAFNLKCRLSRVDMTEADSQLKDILMDIRKLYPDISTKDICGISSKVIDIMLKYSAMYPTGIHGAYPWKHKIYTIYNSITETEAPDAFDYKGEPVDIDYILTSATNELDRLAFSNDAPGDITYATEAASRNENMTEKDEKKAIQRSQKNAERDRKRQEVAQKFNNAKNNVGKAYAKFMDKEEAIDTQLDKITRGLKDIVFDTNAKQKREEVIQGGKHWTPLQVLGRVIMGYAVFNYSKIAGIALLVTRHYTRKNCTKKERRKAIVELEHEIKIVEEKINDAQGAGDMKAKYALMRTKNSLESALDQIRNSYKKMPDAELAGAKKALINVEVNSNGK